MQMKHELKIYPEYFYGVVIGVKKAELRRTDDRTFTAGTCWCFASVPTVNTPGDRLSRV